MKAFPASAEDDRAATAPPAAVPAEERIQQTLRTIEAAIRRIEKGPQAEQTELRKELDALRKVRDKLTRGRVTIAVLGEISTGKSALINALIGREVAAVDVRGGWTREVWGVSWEGTGYRLPGLAESEVVLVDTPGVNEVAGAERGQRAVEAAHHADLVLFVTDSDLNEVEFAALSDLARINKPLVLVLNKFDLYDREQRQRLLKVLAERVETLLPAERIVPTIADPREMEYVIVAADGSERREWRKPEPTVAPLKEQILNLLEREGLALVALNGALFAADVCDRIAAVRVNLRSAAASKVVWSCAVGKGIAVGANPVPVMDVVGGAVVDGGMVLMLSRVYGLEMSTAHATSLVRSIAQSAGWVIAGELATHVVSATLKALTLGGSTVLTALPQSAAAAYGTYIVGQAAKYYFEHGSSWGGESAKRVVRRIVAEAREQSVLQQMKSQIQSSLARNLHGQR